MSTEVDLFALAADAWERRSQAEQEKAKPEPHQRVPDGSWYGYALLGGRGAGKTWTAARYIVDHVHGPPCMPGRTPHQIAIVAPTLGDAATACFSGSSGIGSQDPTAKMVTARGGTVIRWPNGSIAKLFGSNSENDVERLRAGGGNCRVWLEELAAMRYLDQTFEQMQFGLRLGDDPRWIASTTPKPRALIKRLSKGELPNVVVKRATMWENPHLPAHIRQALEDAYGARQIGRQELYAEIIEEAEGALWTRGAIDATRTRPDDVPDLARITVGVDPSGGQGEQGIVVAGVTRASASPDGMAHGYVLDDRTVRLSPDGWGRAAIRAALDWDADDIVAEVNYGGDLVVATIASAAQAMRVNIPIRKVTASRGKRVRAEPVSALTDQGRWHLAGVFPELEEQMCTFTDDSDGSPDRYDAMVWTAWHLKLARAMSSAKGSFSGAAMAKTQIV